MSSAGSSDKVSCRWNSTVLCDTKGNNRPVALRVALKGEWWSMYSAAFIVRTLLSACSSLAGELPLR